MANYVLGALRKWGKTHGASFKTSHSFRIAAVAASGLSAKRGQEFNDYDVEMDKRTFQFRRSAALQRELEVTHKQKHSRRLKVAVDKAIECGLVPSSAATAVLQGNASRHKRWLTHSKWKKKNDDIESASGWESSDPWFQGPDPWATSASAVPPPDHSCDDTVLLDKLEIAPSRKDAASEPFRPIGICEQVPPPGVDILDDGSTTIRGRYIPNFHSECAYNFVLLACQVSDVPCAESLPPQAASQPLHVVYEPDDFVFDLQDCDITIRFASKGTQCRPQSYGEAHVQTDVILPTRREVRNTSSQCEPTVEPPPEDSYKENDIIDKFLSYCHDGARSRLDVSTQVMMTTTRPVGTQTTMRPMQPMKPPPPKLLQPYVCNIPRTKLRRSPDGAFVPIPAAMVRSKISGNKLFLISILDRALEAQPLLWEDWCWFVRRHGCTTTNPLTVPDTYLESYLSKLYGIVISPTEVF